MTKRILIGKITAAHGIKGLVKIFPMCEDFSLLSGTLFTEETGDKTLDIKIKNSAGKFLLAEVAGITDRNAAEILKTPLYIDRSALPTIDEDAFYITDLIGLDVIDESGAKIGHVCAVDNFGAGDLIEIQPLMGENYYVPLHETYVHHTDLIHKKIYLLEPANLFKNIS